MIRRLPLAAGAALLLVMGFFAWAYWQALQPPIVRHATVHVRDWPPDMPSRTVLLISDTHVAGPDMPPARLAAIMDDLNRLKPDLVLLAGDYISDKRTATRTYDPDQAIAPLARLKAPLGIVAVLGNHDYWHDEAGFRAAFARHGIPLLDNGAIRRGPFVIGGIDDGFTDRDDVAATWRAMAALGAGPRLLLSHTSKVLDDVPAPVAALLAGHSHCGQMVLPNVGFAIGPVAPKGWHPCGQRKIRGTPTFVTAGLGTSIVPLRLGAPPDVWLIRFGPAR